MERYKLGELIDVTRGASLAGDNYATEGELVRLTLGNFDYQSNGFKQNSSKDNIFYNGEVDSSFILEEGDIITPLTEQAIGLLGSTAKIPESGKYIQSQDVALVKVKSEKLVHDFAYYLLPTASVKKQLSAGAQQTSIRHTSPDKIKDCTVYIPEPTEQQKIADFLNQIEEKIAINKKENETLEAMAKQLYDYWFIQFDFPDANGRPYKTSGGKMVWNDTLKREIPEGWDDCSLIDIANITMGQSPDGSSYNCDGNGMIFYQGSTDFGLRFPDVRQYTTAPTRFAKKGDILMSVRAPVGAINIANNDCCIGRGLAALNSKIGSVSHLYYVINDLRIAFERKNAAGTTFGAITKDELCDLSVLKPSNSVLSKYESICKEIFDKQMVIGKEMTLLKKQRDFVLPLFMSGQLSL